MTGAPATKHHKSGSFKYLKGATMYEERIAKGIAVLDERVPGWQDKINVSTLRMESGISCVLGQTFGSFWKGANTVLGDDPSTPEPVQFDETAVVVDESVEHGFYIRGEGNDRLLSEYQVLTAEWITALENHANQMVSV